jgi:hypothetical protein
MMISLILEDVKTNSERRVHPTQCSEIKPLSIHPGYVLPRLAK